MIEPVIKKLKSFFTRYSSERSSEKRDASSSSSSGSGVVAKGSNPNSEFRIKYRRNKACLAKLNPFGKQAAESKKKTDTMVYLIHCPKHGKIAVYENRSYSGERIKWLPYTALLPDRSWEDSAKIGSILILSNDCEEKYIKLRDDPPFTSIQLLEILKLQLPQSLSFLTRMIFYVRLDSNSKSFQCCSPISQISWMSIDELTAGKVSHVWGPELVQYAQTLKNEFEDFIEQIEEFSLDDVYLYSPRDPPRNAEETMLLELNISEKTIEILYNDFLEHCYPCFSLPIESFKNYMSKYGFNNRDQRLESLFLAFNYKRNGYVSFHELLMGLVALEPNASHQETRIKFIFRFYDFKCKGYLNKSDFERLVLDIYPTLSGLDFREKLFECLQSVDYSLIEDKIAFTNFMQAIRMHRFRGTSKLCRSVVPVFLQLTRAFIHKKKPTFEDLKEWGDLSMVLIPRTSKGVCKKCKSISYKLATHAVSIDANGYICDPIRMFTYEPKIECRSSDFTFNSSSISNVIIKIVREFNETKGTLAAPRGLLDLNDKKKMYDLLHKLAAEAKPILRNEPRLAHATSPCYVIGDIHGNIEDLLTLEKLLWRDAPCSGANFLFLGDYVDRGKWGFECALYLLALKLLDPQKVILLRGNHEVRALQDKYTFKKECLRKYAEYGEKMWELINSIFDLLPIAGTIDNAIFCAHGGLSPNVQKVEQIKKIPLVLSDPEHQSKVAWEVLWSDPCHIQHYLDIIELNDVNNDFSHEGYVYNQKRGASYLFNERAAISFLNRNGLSHIIRAHEVPPFGFAHHFKNLCTTVFSCSHYCSYDNESACILVDNERIRVIRLDTHNNAPATDAK